MPPTQRPSTPDEVPAALCEMAADIRAAILLDAAGAPIAASGVETDAVEELAELARRMLDAVDRASPHRPVEQFEVQVDRGGVYALRGPRFTLAAVADRNALPSLTFCDLRFVVSGLEDAA